VGAWFERKLETPVADGGETNNTSRMTDRNSPTSGSETDDTE
jgi:hypothetical protein